LVHEDHQCIGTFSFGRNQRVIVPVAIAQFPEPAPNVPRSWAERCFNVVRWTAMPRGGHFPAAEEPGLLAEGIRVFLSNIA
jgi:pimeloyl-ACP methyl ester carboxylesterase